MVEQCRQCADDQHQWQRLQGQDEAAARVGDRIRGRAAGQIAEYELAACQRCVLQRGHHMVERQQRLAREIEAGMVGINTNMIAGADSPFGGVRWSGHGAEDGPEGVLACMVTKAVHEG